MRVLDLPPELIVSIISYLSPHDIISCQRTCRKLCDVCKDTALRYLVQMERFGVSDDLWPGISYPERLLLLQRREEAWANLDFSKSVQVTVPFESTGIYDFTGGAFLLGTRLHATRRRPTIGYSYVTLPSLSSSETEDPNSKWHGLYLGIQVLDVGLAVHEHDLIALLTACVSLAISSLNKLTSREGDRTRMTQFVEIMPWKYGYSAFPPASPILLPRNLSSS
jgi:hypothetical protein